MNGSVKHSSFLILPSGAKKGQVYLTPGVPEGRGNVLTPSAKGEPSGYLASHHSNSLSERFLNLKSVLLCRVLKGPSHVTWLCTLSFICFYLENGILNLKCLTATILPNISSIFLLKIYSVYQIW